MFTVEFVIMVPNEKQPIYSMCRGLVKEILLDMKEILLDGIGEYELYWDVQGVVYRGENRFYVTLIPFWLHTHTHTQTHRKKPGKMTVN